MIYKEELNDPANILDHARLQELLADVRKRGDMATASQAEAELGVRVAVFQAHVTRTESQRLLLWTRGLVIATVALVAATCVLAWATFQG